MSEPQNGADLLARIQPKLNEASTELCMRPDLLEAWEQADEALTTARTADAGSGRLADGGVSQKTKRAAKKVKDLEKEIAANAIKFHFRAIPNYQWRELCDKHAPRENNRIDAFYGYNRDAVLDDAVRLCLTDPVFDDASWGEFLKVCNPSEWAELREMVEMVNRGVTAPPKSQLASQVLAQRESGSN